MFPSLFVSGKCSVRTDGQPIAEVLDKLEDGMSIPVAKHHMVSMNLQSF